MSLLVIAVAPWVVLLFTFLGYLAGLGRGLTQGQVEAVRQVEQELAPVLLEELLKQGTERARVQAAQTEALERYRKAKLN